MVTFSFRLAALWPLTAGFIALSAQEPPLDFAGITAKMEAGLATEERNYTAAQAKVKEALVKEFDKLLKAESKRKNSPLVPELESRIEVLTKEITLLKDYQRFKVTQLDELLSQKKLTEQDWESAPGTIIAVKASSLRQATDIVLENDQQYYVLPNPKDVWKASDAGPDLSFAGDKKDLMKLVVHIGDKVAESFWISEPGPLSFGANDKAPKDNTGEIRVKVIRLR